MTATFITQLRASRPPIVLEDGAGAITLRVAASELWDTVRVTARPGTPVAEVKQRVVSALYTEHAYPDDFVLKFRGWEILDEGASLQDTGILNGSIILLAYRRRRPVR